VPEYQAYEDLVVGDCFDPIADNDDDSLLAGQIRACDSRHLMEVVGTPDFEEPLGEPYPGIPEIDRRAEEACRLAFREYVGVDFDDSRLAATFYSPPEEFWLAGDRSILCVVTSTTAGPLTRSVEGLEL
jgi:hypothetical protein